MRPEMQNDQVHNEEVQEPPKLVVERLIEKRLEELVTFLSTSDGRKSKLYEEVMAMVEKGLFKVALHRSKNVKCTAAAFLGINRNTFADKMARLGLSSEKNK